MAELKQTVAVDFDGVLHAYSKGWQDGSIYDEPVEGAMDALATLAQRYRLVVYTARPRGQLGEIAAWVQRHLGDREVDVHVTNLKPPAVAYIDDRAVRFENWAQALREVGAL